MNTQASITLRSDRQQRNASMVNLAMNVHSNYDSLLEKLAEQKDTPAQTKDQIEIQNGKQNLSFLREDILWVEAAGDYLYIHTNKGRSNLIRKTMKSIEQILGDQHFIRVHRSYIVNKSHIKKYGNNVDGEKVVTLKNSHELSVSRRFKARVSATFMQ